MPYRLTEFVRFPNLIHGFSTREAGNMSFKWGETKKVATNREKFLAELELKAEAGVTAELVHGDTILRVGQKDTGHGMMTNDYKLQADGLVCNKPGVFLFHVIADCLSLLFYDPEHKAIGLAHAGRHQPNAQISQLMVNKLQTEFATNPAKLIVGIGPAIHQCCYSFLELPPGINDNWRPFLSQGRDGHTNLNLVGYNLYQLSAAGVEQENIFLSEYCTAHSGKFFSHYASERDKKSEARFAAVIGLQ